MGSDVNHTCTGAGRSELDAGDLDGETAKFLRDLCRHLSLNTTGKQSVLLAQLKAHSEMLNNEDSSSDEESEVGEDDVEEDGDVIGNRVAKKFGDIVHLGEVMERWVDKKTGYLFFHVVYDDGDAEDLSRDEYEAAYAHYWKEGAEIDTTRTRTYDEYESPTAITEPPSLLKDQLHQTMGAAEAKKLVLNSRSMSKFTKAIEMEGIVDPQIAWPEPVPNEFNDSTNKKRRLVDI